MQQHIPYIYFVIGWRLTYFLVAETLMQLTKEDEEEDEEQVTEKEDPLPFWHIMGNLKQISEHNKTSDHITELNIYRTYKRKYLKKCKAL